MALVWRTYDPASPLVVGTYYKVSFQFPFNVTDVPGIKDAVEFGLRNAPEWSGPIRVQNFTWTKLTAGGKADGELMEMVFQAVPHPLITESGFDVKSVLSIAGIVILGIMAVNGTLKGVFAAVDDSVKAVGDSAKAASKIFDPMVLIGIAVVLLVAMPLLKGGIK